MTRSIATGARASPLCRLPSVAPAAASGCLFPRGFRRAGRRPPRGIARSTLALAARADIPRVGPGGCFVDHCDARVSGAPSGPLAGLTFAAKDNLDVLGFASGCGNPRWLETHPDPAPAHAPAVAALLNAGASLVGKTQMDELAWALTGENAHYGTPMNPAAPSRVPGGSSSGSAVAVAAGFCDVALGTDTAGSVRVPAGYCGIFGFRPTHGAVSLAGCVPLAPSFDVVGLFAAEPRALEAAGDALLDGAPGPSSDRLRAEMDDSFRFVASVTASDAFEICDAASLAATSARVAAFASRDAAFATPSAARLGGDGVGGRLPPLTEWWESFRVAQTREVWRELGPWVESSGAMSTFGPGVRDRFEGASDVSAEDAAAAAETRGRITARMDAIVANGTVLILPTTPGPPVAVDSTAEVVQAYRERQLALTTAAGMAGLPQITAPAGVVDGAPIGLSLIGARGTDKALLRLACELLG